MQLEPERADEARVVARVAVQVGEGRPIVRPGRVRLDEEEVPVRLGVTGHPERQVPAPGGHGDRPLESLEGGLGPLRDRELAPRPRRRRRLVEIRVDGVPEADAVLLVRVDLELADRGRRQVRGHRLLRIPEPCRPAALRPALLELAVGDRLEAVRHGDLERVGGLVARMVVDRVPGRRHVRLPGDQRAVVRSDEARDAEALDDRLGNPVVPDLDDEPPAVPDPLARRDRQLVLVARPGRPSGRRREPTARSVRRGRG